jgi:hypothetical protein
MQPVAWPEPDPLIAAAITGMYGSRHAALLVEGAVPVGLLVGFVRHRLFDLDLALRRPRSGPARTPVHGSARRVGRAGG